jgi:hypothetical protein
LHFFSKHLALVAVPTKNLLNSMKIKTSLLLTLLAAASLSAAPLSKTTAVHAKPNASSPAIAVLNAGTEPVLATSAAPAPGGWTAVELVGPHEVYVQNKDIMKSLDIKVGSNLYTAPKIDAPVLTTMAKGDIAEISGLHGRWTQVKLQKKVIGYIGDDSVVSPVVVAAASTASINAPAGVNATQPVAASASPVQVYTGPGQAAPSNTLNPAAAAALPRMFEGTFVPAKRFLAYKPYEYQLNDRSGQRYAFLDVSRLPKAEPVDKYLNRIVTVYGSAKAIENTKDIVIEVDSIQQAR